MEKVQISVEKMRIPVRVHPIIREFLLDTTKTDVITPVKGDIYWSVIQNELELPPDDYKDPTDIQNLIYIELPNCHGHKAFSNEAGKAIYIDTMFRWYLSKKAQIKINSILKANFKNSYHCFMQGAIVGNPELQQKEAMELFCDLYNLSMDKVTPDMLKKSWMRSDHKKKINTNKFRINLICF